jgi:hypothetical protein
MKIRFLSGPRAGQIDHAPNSQEMQLMAKAGLIEILPYSSFRERLANEASPAAKLGAASWSVGVGQMSQQVEIKAACSVCGSQFRFQGGTEAGHVNNGPGKSKVVDPKKFCFQHSCGMYPEPIPASIWKEYVAADRTDFLYQVEC